MRILISGGPGSGCTSTASAVGAALHLPVFDSDSFFHKPSDPPFQQQYSPDERRDLLKSATGAKEIWAAGYETRTGAGRNLATDRAFLEAGCDRFMVITDAIPFQELVTRVIGFLSEPPDAEQAAAMDRMRASAGFRRL